MTWVLAETGDKQHSLNWWVNSYDQGSSHMSLGFQIQHIHIFRWTYNKLESPQGCNYLKLNSLHSFKNSNVTLPPHNGIYLLSILNQYFCPFRQISSLTLTQSTYSHLLTFVRPPAQEFPPESSLLYPGQTGNSGSNSHPEEKPIIGTSVFKLNLYLSQKHETSAPI